MFHNCNTPIDSMWKEHTFLGPKLVNWSAKDFAKYADNVILAKVRNAKSNLKSTNANLAPNN